MRRPHLPLFTTLVLTLSLLPACGRQQARADALAAQELAEQRALEAQQAEQLERALEQATTVVAEAAEEPAIEDIDVRGRFIQAVNNGDWSLAQEYQPHWAADSDDKEGQDAELLLLLHEGHFDEARARAWTFLTSFPDVEEHWRQRWYQSWMSDESFWRAEPYDLERERDFDKLEALGGGSTVTLKVLLNGEIVGVLKPHSTLEQTNYRGEVAAYRLCEIMQCGFHVPQNTEVRIRVRDFLRAYGISSLTRSKGYSRRFSDLITFTDENGEEWIHGTLKAWAPGFTTYPVEHTDGWISLLNGATSRERLENMSLEDALRPMRGKERAYVGAILDRRGETDALDFARQLSNLHVFDYLLNNWDRYSGVFWGVNLQWNHGQFVSIDNGAVLQRRSWGSSVATRNRMRRIRIFSKATVEALRQMDYAQTRQLLLPTSPHHPDEDERFELFWARRVEFLSWLDALIESRGEDRVLVLP